MKRSAARDREMIERARKKGPRTTLVAGAAGPEVLRAVTDAARLGLIRPVLIGPAVKIRGLARRLRIDLAAFRIVDRGEDPAIAETTAEMASRNEASLIMKGNISTPVLLKSILDPRFNLRTGGLLSHIAWMEVPAAAKPFAVTDSGMVIRPTLDQKVLILRNAVAFTSRMGIRKPRIALLAANEKVSPHMTETMDAVELVRMAAAGVFGEAVVEGPLALDMAFSAEAARIKGIRSRVAGKPDIVLVPDIASGNIFAKGLVYLAQARISGLVVGARLPIVLISRAEHAETWLHSIALAGIVS
jgi:phosphate butyryltransferase